MDSSDNHTPTPKTAHRKAEKYITNRFVLMLVPP
jgi:hypothetical protein